MASRREFLVDSLRLAALAGVATGAAACAGARAPAPVASASLTSPGEGSPLALASPPAASASGDGPQPPPDLFDANLLAPDFWTRPRTIHWTRPSSGEELQLVYWKDGVQSKAAYERMCHILRDVDARQERTIDPKLLETLWACQAFCARYGINHPLEILSGYRTPATNAKLQEQGLAAARKSLHLEGRAADFRLVGLNTEILGGLVQSFARGGVGFYFRPGTVGGWIHADTGLQRTWQG